MGQVPPDLYSYTVAFPMSRVHVGRAAASLSLCVYTETPPMVVDTHECV